MGGWVGRISGRVESDEAADGSVRVHGEGLRRMGVGRGVDSKEERPTRGGKDVEKGQMGAAKGRAPCRLTCIRPTR